jgi:hypothetical protein
VGGRSSISYKRTSDIWIVTINIPGAVHMVASLDGQD